MNREYKREGRLLTIENLNLDYHGNKILRDINLKVDDIHRPNMQQGQVIALLGPSGIGKTQLFNCISGLMQPTSGAVLLNADKHPVQAGEVGFVFQNYPLMLHRTIFDNLMLAAKNAGKKKEEVLEFLTLFGLEDKVKHYPDQLSGGQRQRISIVQQLICADRFVLMDEPFSGLDIISKNKMMNLITKVSQVHEQNTFILTTHDIEAAVSIADTIWVIGYQKDAKGSFIPGATIVKEVDLIDCGLAWDSSVRTHPYFHKKCDELYKMFDQII